MTHPVVAVRDTASVAEAARMMRQRGLGWLAVVEKVALGADRLVGVLGRSDLLKVFERDDTELRDEIIEALRTRLVINPDQVGVEVSQGVVTLAGGLPTRAEARLVAEFVERLEGVVAVTDELTYELDERVADAQVGPLY